jgi:RNA polymerase sigma-70 factor (ECF subfamily)
MTAQPCATADPSATIRHHVDNGAYHDAITVAAHSYGALVGRCCHALLGSQGEAEEAAQEAFLAAYTNLSRYRGESSFKAWLLGIARHICARRVERGVRHRQKLRLVADSPTAAELPEEAAAQQRRRQWLDAALQKLRPSEREALVLRFALDLRYREIAEACGVDEAAARKRASRGLNRLRQLLTEEDRP